MAIGSALASLGSSLASRSLGLFGLGVSSAKILLVGFGIGALSGGYAGHWVTKNYYQAKEAYAINQQLKNQEIHRREVETLLRNEEALEQLVRDLEREAQNLSLIHI